MVKLKNSGYSVKFRKDILNSAFNAFDKMLKDNETGVEPLFRNREWNKEQRVKLKQDRKLNWYKNSKSKIDYQSVLFVPVTK